MTEDSFLKAMIETLEDEVDRIDFEKVSPEYAAKVREINKIMETLDPMLETIIAQTKTAEIREQMEKLELLWITMNETCFDIGLKRGFSLAYQTIFYWLTVDAGKVIKEK